MRAIPFFEQYDFKKWEKALIVFSILLFLGSFYLYVTGYPLRRYLFNIDDEGHGHSIGTVSLKQGALRRQFNGEAEFKGIGLAESLYDEDTLVTGSDASATLTLDDGSTIELAPNTMVRLHFSTNLTLSGISRAAVVDLVAGSVKPKARDRVVIHRPARAIEVPHIAVIPVKPVPKPEVKRIKNVELVVPRNGTELTLDKGNLTQEKKVAFTWQVTPVDRPVQLTLWKLDSRAPGAARMQVYRETLLDNGGQGVAEWTLKAPGWYQWELRGPKGETIPGVKKTTANFTLKRDFEAIEPLEPLVGGELLSSSKLRGRQNKNFNITLRWKPYPGATQYRVAVKIQPNGKPVLEKQVRAAEYLFNKDKVLTGQIYYEVTSSLKSGFVAHSELKPFAFTFMAPTLVAPINHVILTKEQLEPESDSILITWQKTNFTEWYELQIAKDAEFKDMADKEKLAENFYIFKAPPVGKYYWRVRSSSKSVLSPFTSAYDLTVAP